MKVPLKVAEKTNSSAVQISVEEHKTGKLSNMIPSMEQVILALDPKDNVNEMPDNEFKRIHNKKISEIQENRDS